MAAMKQWALKAVIMVILPLFVMSVKAAEAQSSPVTIKLPVHGTFALPVGNITEAKLLSVDTYTGTVQTLVKERGMFENPVWDKEGKRIAYDNLGDSAILNFATNTSQIIERFAGHSEDEFFDPIGWSAEGDNILYEGVVAGFPSTTLTYYLFDVNSGELTPLRSFQTAHLTPDLPPPPGINSLILYEIFRVKRNPVYDHWVAMLMWVVDSQMVDDPNNPPGNAPQENVVDEIILWNYETDQMITLSGLISDIRLNDLTLAWSIDGKLLAVTTIDNFRKSKVRTFYFDNEGHVTVAESAFTDRYVEFWLGAGDLLLAWDTKSDKEGIDYYIGEIIKGEWHEKEFLHLDQATSPTFFGSKGGDWHISASDEEKQALACLFGHAPDGATCDNQSG